MKILEMIEVKIPWFWFLEILKRDYSLNNRQQI